MKDFEEIVPLIVAFCLAVILFLGVISAIKKSLKPAVNHDSLDSTLQLKEQRRRMEDIQRRQKQLMEDQRQKIRDLQRQ